MSHILLFLLEERITYSKSSLSFEIYYGSGRGGGGGRKSCHLSKFHDGTQLIYFPVSSFLPPPLSHTQTHTQEIGQSVFSKDLVTLDSISDSICQPLFGLMKRYVEILDR